jgi:hypothetical protein
MAALPLLPFPQSLSRVAEPPGKERPWTLPAKAPTQKRKRSIKKEPPDILQTSASLPEGWRCVDRCLAMSPQGEVFVVPYLPADLGFPSRISTEAIAVELSSPEGGHSWLQNSPSGQRVLLPLLSKPRSLSVQELQHFLDRRMILPPRPLRRPAWHCYEACFPLKQQPLMAVVVPLEILSQLSSELGVPEDRLLPAPA